MARPQDIGQQYPSDATTLNLPDVHEGRSQSDYGARPETSEAIDPVNLPTSTTEQDPGRQFKILIDLDEMLVCHELYKDSNGDEEEGDIFFYIAKPIELRKSTFDTDGDPNDDGFIVSLVSSGRRSKEANGYTLYQVVSPAYSIGSSVYAVAIENSGVSGATFIDINNDARHWVNEEPAHRYFIIDDLDRDTFDCWEWDPVTKTAIIPDGAPSDERYLVAKVPILRGTSWDQQTIDGITYDAGTVTESNSHDYREADDGSTTEDQEIIPVWLEGSTFPNITVIEAEFIETGTGAYRDGVQALWQDKNSGGHAFSEKYA